MSNIDVILECLNEAVFVDLTPWQNSSGKKTPGAQNRGSWIFSSDRKGDEETFNPKGSMLYTDAKKLAVKWANDNGLTRVYVQG